MAIRLRQGTCGAKGYRSWLLLGMPGLELPKPVVLAHVDVEGVVSFVDKPDFVA